MTRQFFCTSVLVTGLLVLAVDRSHARKHEHFGAGFSIDLTQPYNEVVNVVEQISNDGIIRGTFQYKGTKELDGAEPAKTSNAFSAWTGQG
ncbi:MAG TPA: hypothetical protein VGV15_14855, partial [Terriglobales bacterium]|nr:hypothetical protein [Terriglobales bacterium]